MLHILALILLGGVIWIAILSIPLVLVGGLRWDDLRSLLLHYAYKSFTFEGDVIPGVRPFIGTRLVIRTLSPENDARRALVAVAIAIADERRPRRNRRARLRAAVNTGSAMSFDVVQARWFTAPVLGARFRAPAALGAAPRG